MARNRGPDGSYWAPVAHRAAHERRRRPKGFKLAENPALCRRIEDWMDEGWSPGLIAQVLRDEHGANMTGRVSHETIYQALYVQTRGGLRADLHRQLSPETPPAQAPRHAGRGAATAPTRRRSRSASDPPRSPTGPCPGHWEGDLIIGHRQRLGDRDPGGTLDPVHDLAAPARPPRRREPSPRR